MLTGYPTRIPILSESAVEDKPKDLSSHPTRMLVLPAPSEAGSDQREPKDPSNLKTTGQLVALGLSGGATPTAERGFQREAARRYRSRTARMAP